MKTTMLQPGEALGIETELTAEVIANETEAWLSSLDEDKIREYSRLHSVEPTFKWVQPYSKTYGDVAADFAAKYGLVLDEFQRRIVRDALAVDEKGQWVNRVAGVSFLRQAGKTAIIEVIELFCSVILGEKILHTSHEVKTSAEAFDRLVGFFDNPEHVDLVQAKRRIVRAPGSQGIWFKNGGYVRFIAREKNSGRGFTVDRIIFDEAMHIKPASIATLLPTTGSGKNQNSAVMYFGTPPGPSHMGEAFTKVREEALRKATGMSWHEWSPEADSMNVDDWKTWARCNPALGAGRYQIPVIIMSRLTMSEEQFAREMLGAWVKVRSDAVVDEVAWEKIEDENSMMVGRRCLAIDVAPDRNYSAVCVAGEREDGSWHIELVDTRKGTEWLAPFVESLISTREPGWFSGVLVDEYGPTGNLLPEFKKRGVRVTTIGFKELMSANLDFFDMVNAQRVFHIGQTQLTASLGVSTKRMVGEKGWKVTRSSGDSNVTPVIAAILALYGASAKKGLKRPKRGEAPKDAPQRRPGGSLVLGW